MNISSNQPASASPEDASQKTNGQRYATIWRWHFYAGAFIAPFLIILAVTGLAMMFLAYIDGRDGERLNIEVPAEAIVQPVSVQAKSALKSLPDGQLKQYIAPRSKDMIAIFRIDKGEDRKYVGVNPYTAETVKIYPRRQGTYQLMDDIHGDLLIGKTGDFLLESAASLTILMIVTGWYLWWVKQKSLKQTFLPQLRKLKNNKIWWKNSHGATGAWISIILLFFLLSGLAWAGIWGGKMVQAWSQFPDAKWNSVPKSDISKIETHGEALNGSTKEVPWILELTPMPVSNPENKSSFSYDPKVLKNLDVINSYARENGFVGRYQMHLPKNETGVWTLSQDSMSYDSENPMADRTLHLDQYTGEKLADVRFKDYNLIGKAMAVGIALHMGNLGWWSILANVIFCLAVIFMCIGGLVMWWKRRPSKAVGLAPPPNKAGTSVGLGLAILLLVLAVAFPTAIIVITAIALLDFILISRVNVLTRLLK